MAEVVQDSGCSDLTGFAPLTDAFLSSHAQENMIETTPSFLQPLWEWQKQAWVKLRQARPNCPVVFQQEPAKSCGYK